MTLYQNNGVELEDDYLTKPKVIVPNNGLAFANVNKDDQSLHGEGSEMLENLKGNSKISNSSLDQGDAVSYLEKNVQIFK